MDKRFRSPCIKQDISPLQLPPSPLLLQPKHPHHTTCNPGLDSRAHKLPRYPFHPTHHHSRFETMQATSRTAKAIQTTKWGTACAQCASAKAKCSRKATDRPGTKCDRCERLLKQCTDQVHRPRKPRQPKQQSVHMHHARLQGRAGRGDLTETTQTDKGSETAPAMTA